MSTSGFLLINKPADWTSHDVIAHLRKVTGIKTIGHAGTLDPFATGLLIVGVGREATKQLGILIKHDKVYEATFILGATSDTGDLTGKIIRSVGANGSSPKLPTEKEIREILKLFIGEQLQIPPMFSAKKFGGKKLYELARQGQTVERQPSQITIFSIELLDYNWPELKIKIHCSSGTYIRVLAQDIGEKLGVGSYVSELKRTAIDRYLLTEAIDLNDLTKDNWEKFLIKI
jgi:tRNA pseudouridine55 synthase